MKVERIHNYVSSLFILKNFQIFPQKKNKRIVPVICNELVKAIRAEILIRRGEKIPTWQELRKDGKLEATEPLFFNKKTNPQILCGSLKHKAPQQLFLEKLLMR